MLVVSLHRYLSTLKTRIRRARPVIRAKIALAYLRTVFGSLFLLCSPPSWIVFDPCLAPICPYLHWTTFLEWYKRGSPRQTLRSKPRQNEHLLPQELSERRGCRPLPALRLTHFESNASFGSILLVSAISLEASSASAVFHVNIRITSVNLLRRRNTCITRSCTSTKH